MRLLLLALAVVIGLVHAQDDNGGGANPHMTVIAHGTLMSLAFLIFLPFGALTVRVLSFNHMVWVHASLQLLALCLVITGAGLGIWIAVTTQQLNMAHPIIGLIVFSLLVLQPIGGLWHHLINRKSATPHNTLIGESHKWLGRVLILLGAINGGLGLQLSANTTGGEIAYGVVAGVVFVIYVVVDVMAIRNEKRKNKGEAREKMLPSRESPATTAPASMDGSATMRV